MQYEHWNAVGDKEQQEIMADSVKPIFEAGLAQTVEMDHRISPEIRLTPTTGLDLTPWFALAALFCLLLSAKTWEKRRRATAQPSYTV